ncbi:MAG: helix-turn-helix domain-containing protein [Anaerolineae bacterium]
MSGEFGALLKRKRKAAGLSQSALAKAAGISPSHLNRIEKGNRNPPPSDKILDIANALRLSPAETDQLLVAAGYAPRYGQLPSSGPRPDISPEVRALIQEVTTAILRVAEDPNLTPAQREDVVRILRTLDLPAMIARVGAAIPGVSEEQQPKALSTQVDVTAQDAETLFADWQREYMEDIRRQRPSELSAYLGVLSQIGRA